MPSPLLAMKLYRYLTDANRRRVRIIVDRNPQCRLAVETGLPVTRSLADLPSHTGVLISSYEHREMLREELQAEDGRLETIDIYAALEQQGIPCAKDMLAFRPF